MLPTWLHPSRLNGSNSYLVRLGRVLHYTGIGLAAFFVFAAVDAALMPNGYPVWWLALAVAVALGGRALRYVLSDE